MIERENFETEARLSNVQWKLATMTQHQIFNTAEGKRLLQLEETLQKKLRECDN